MEERSRDRASSLHRDRIRGCLLGGAIGDALGAPVEFWSRAQIEAQCGGGGVQGYLPVAFGEAERPRLSRGSDEQDVRC